MRIDEVVDGLIDPNAESNRISARSLLRRLRPRLILTTTVMKTVTRAVLLRPSLEELKTLALVKLDDINNWFEKMRVSPTRRKATSQRPT